MFCLPLPLVLLLTSILSTSLVPLPVAVAGQGTAGAYRTLEFYLQEAIYRNFAQQLKDSGQIRIDADVKISTFGNHPYNVRAEKYFKLKSGKSLKVENSRSLKLRLESKQPGQRLEDFFRYLARRWAVAYLRGLNHEYEGLRSYRGEVLAPQIEAESHSGLFYGWSTEFVSIGSIESFFMGELEANMMWGGLESVHKTSVTPQWDSAIEEINVIKRIAQDVSALGSEGFRAGNSPDYFLRPVLKELVLLVGKQAAVDALVKGGYSLEQIDQEVNTLRLCQISLIEP